jgi:hypothetical protein
MLMPKDIGPAEVVKSFLRAMRRVQTWGAKQQTALERHPDYQEGVWSARDDVFWKDYKARVKEIAEQYCSFRAVDPGSFKGFRSPPEYDERLDKIIDVAVRADKATVTTFQVDRWGMESRNKFELVRKKGEWRITLRRSKYGSEKRWAKTPL